MLGRSHVFREYLAYLAPLLSYLRTFQVHNPVFQFKTSNSVTRHRLSKNINRIAKSGWILGNNVAQSHREINREFTLVRSRLQI